MSGEKSGVSSVAEAAERDVRARADGEPAGGDEQLSLLDDDPAADDGDRVFSAGGRKAGRPKGAMNKKTQALSAYYKARGFKDPISFLGDLVSADPLELRAWLKEHDPEGSRDLLEIIKLQRSAAVDLAPYLHGKMPISIDVADERLPALIIDLGTNQLDQDRSSQGAGVLSVGEPDGELPDDES